MIETILIGWLIVALIIATVMGISRWLWDIREEWRRPRKREPFTQRAWAEITITLVCGALAIAVLLK